MITVYERLKRRCLYKAAAPWRWAFLQFALFFVTWYCFVFCVPALFAPVDHLVVAFYGVVYAIWKTSAHLFLVNRDAELGDVPTKTAIRYVVCGLCVVLHCFVIYVHCMLLIASARMVNVDGVAHVAALYVFLSVALVELLYTYVSIPWRTYPERLTPLAVRVDLPPSGDLLPRPLSDSARKKVNLEDVD